MCIILTNFEFTKRYDSRWNEIYYKDSKGLEILKTFDNDNNIIYENNISKKIESWYTYDDKNRCTRIKRSNGYEAYIIYDDEKHTSSFRDSNKKFMNIRYDEHGNQIYIESNNGVSLYYYNGQNKITSSIVGDLTTNYEYDKDGNLISKSNNMGYNEWRIYDLKNNCIYLKTSRGNVTTFKYDDNDNCIYKKNHNTGEEIFLEYDKNNHLILRKTSNGQVMTIEYNDAGQPVHAIDAIFEKTYEYDNAGNLIHYTRSYSKLKDNLFTGEEMCKL